MPFLSLDYEQAHQFVETQQIMGNNVEWDGWELVFWKPSPKAITSKNGVLKSGKWGFEKRIYPDDNGNWSVPLQNARTKKDKDLHLVQKRSSS